MQFITVFNGCLLYLHNKKVELEGIEPSV